MDRPRIRDIAINVKDREKAAEYYKEVFKLEDRFIAGFTAGAIK